MQNNHDIDLVFLDVEMPGTNGIEFLRKIGGSLPKTDFVFISGHDKFEYVREAMRYHAVDYLLKPIDKDEITRIVKNARKLRERDVVEVAMRAQVGVLTADIQKSAREIWGSSDTLVTACCVCQALEENVVDVVLLGIGENGHIAFNDPHVADFNDSQLVKVVSLDDVCRNQQVNDGCFKTIDDVPKFALTLTIPALTRAKHMICTVPAPTKARAVGRTVNGEINEECPATIMRRHDSAVMFCDSDSGRDLL